MLTKEEGEFIQNLRARGFAVIVWTPEELECACPKHVQAASVELGWDIIEELKAENEE
jgi:hypothetical protein